MTLQVLLDSLSDAYRKHLDPTSPAKMHMMAARGMAPLPPREMVIVLAGLMLSDDDEVRSAAQKTLGGLPDKLLAPTMDTGLPGAVMAPLVNALLAQPEGRDVILEKVVLFRDTPDEVIAQVAPHASQHIAEIIAQNQERCMRSAAVVDAIRKNVNILRSSLDRLFDFLVRAGAIHEEMEEFGEAIARLSPAEMKAAADTIELPDELSHLVEETHESDQRADAIVETLEALDVNETEKQKRIPILQLINSLSIAKKVALALKGNKEARSILVRDANKLVAAAAIRSPRITQAEVVTAANSRSVSEEVIRIISRSKEMSRPYPVKKALVLNPKTPVPIALRLMTLLRAHDIKDIAKSRNVSGAISNHAKRLMARKS